MANATSDDEDSSSLEPGDLSSHRNEANIIPSTPDPTPEQTLSVDSDASPRPSTPPAIAMAARAYQREMLEESLKRNIIVAMETGSGKTQVAILRIQEELERSDKLVWFLAPTVELASQQFRVINSQIPGVQTKFIYGADCVETWTYKPKVWDDILTNIRIVVSTYQILFDAASHGFVPIESLGLVVIDEAHNCVRQNSIARFMRELYQTAKSEGRSVPHILGLTASPLMRSNLADLDVLEQTLDAVCKTPNRHRDELLSQVNRPEMIAQSYRDFPGPEDDAQSTPTMSRLKQTLVQLDIRQDPDVLRLKAERSERSREDLAKIMLTHDTSCQKQMRDFYNRAKGICQVLGPWAADYYIHKVITEFLKGTNSSTAPQAIPNVSINEERKYLAMAFLQVGSLPVPEIPTDLSRKVLALISILESCEQTEPYGIVFVKERATVAVLLRILSTHPALRERYRVGSMVGTSKKQNIFDLGQKEDMLSLQDFRHGKFNLLVGTSVLEEGIDVPVCNLVICFDKPDNLKSFIQRRGRARMSVSRLYLLVEDLSDQSLQEWQILEQEMKRKYEDDMRDIKQLEDMEGSEAIDYPILKDSATGAQLTIHDAKKHLEHFCATLSTRKYVNWMPYYKIRDLEGNPIDSHQPGQRRAIVRLPISLAPELRSAESLFSWTSEADACRDAAFQAYVKLYKVGLINNHLLPMREMDVIKDAEQRPATIRVKEQLNPWPLVAQAWKSGAELSRRRLTLTDNDGSPPLPFEIALPVAVPHMEDFTLYMDTESAWVVSMDSDTPMLEADGAPDREADHTITLLKMAFEHRWPVENKQYPIRFVYRKGDISPDGISAKAFNLESVSGYLVRGITGYSDHHPHIYLDLLPTKPAKELVKSWAIDFDEAPQDAPYVVVKHWPKTAGYFHRPSPSPQQSSKPYPRVLPLNQVKVDSIPLVLGHVGMLIPSITSAVEAYLVARDLLETRLESIGITDLALVVTAITASGAGRHVDYERVEFLGDTILKLCATINCTAKFLYYPESYLSASKDKVVCNSRLCRAAISLGLDQYIILKPATPHQWRPTYVEDLNANPPSVSGTRMVSSKTLADVVEALIGTSFVTGGLPRALACMSLFMPDFNWQDIDAGRQVLYDQVPADEMLPHTMRQLEDLVGYTFTKKALLVEAMTHPSYNALDVRASLDRLEFLGDAILDYIVVKKLFEHQDPQPLTNSHLHIIHTALVNADILGFLVMEWSIKQERVDVNVQVPVATTNGASCQPQEAMVELVQSEVELPLWSFMRYSSPEMGAHQQATRSRHEKMRGELLHAFHHGNAYPWAALARLRVHKFFSDVFESLLGAVWVDSGSMEECEKIVERAGILPLMRRFLKGGVHMPHPREELGVLAGMKTVRYEVEVLQGSNGSGTSSDGEEKGSFGCKVFVDEECIADIIGGVTRDEVKSRAAEEACRFLKQRDPAQRNLPYAHAHLGPPSRS